MSPERNRKGKYVVWESMVHGYFHLPVKPELFDQTYWQQVLMDDRITIMAQKLEMVHFSEKVYRITPSEAIYLHCKG